MAKAQDFDGMIADKRRELAEVKKAAVAATQAAVQAKSELATTLDEQAAIAAVARERVQSNKARVLTEQAVALEREISDLEQEAKKERAATLAADAAGKKAAATDALWAVFDQVQEAADAERAALEAKAAATGDTWAIHSARMGAVATAVGHALERLGAAVQEVHVDGRRTLRKV